MTAPRFNLFPEGVKETNDDCVPEYSQEDEKLRMHKVKRKSLHCQQEQSVSEKSNLFNIRISIYIEQPHKTLTHSIFVGCKTNGRRLSSRRKQTTLTRG